MDGDFPFSLLFLQPQCNDALTFAVNILAHGKLDLLSGLEMVGLSWHNHAKRKANSRVSNQQAVSELKQRVVLALNKLADRDTYQIAVEELEKTIECLNPDGVVPFLSCILDTDAEQKSAVRKECIQQAIAVWFALCLSRIIDNIHDPPPLVLQNMLSKTVKLLKNPHFMAKPAVIELNRSIVLAGGALTHSSLTAALTSIQETLKNSDWSTRKAACAALGDIASCGVACLSSFRTSCLHCLESCRFDKVKPVRDIALQALQLWRNLPRPDTPEPSEAGSSIKEISYRDDYGDTTSASDPTLKDITVINELAKKRIPVSSRKAGRTYSEKSQQSVTDDWHIEIAIPKSQTASVGENQNNESEGSSVTKRCERNNADVWSIKNIGYDYIEVGDKHECSSVSNVFPESVKSKVVTAHCDALDDASLVKSTGTSQQFAADEVSIEEQRYLTRMHDRRSLDSTVTESTSHALTTTIVDSMSKLQLKVSNLELVVDKMAQEPVHGGRYSEPLTSKFQKRGPSIASPRLSTCTPRSSVDSVRRPPLLPIKHTSVQEDHTFSRSRSSSFRKQNSNMWTDATLKLSRTSSGKTDNIFNSIATTKAIPTKLETRNSPWKVVKDYLFDGDLDSAYDEALCSRNELLLFDLLDRTGPVLENLSNKTATELLSTLASYFLDQRFLVHLSNIHGPNYLVLSAEAKRDLLSAILEATKLDFCNPAERKFLLSLAKCCTRFGEIYIASLFTKACHGCDAVDTCTEMDNVHGLDRKKPN
ncbi:hypothetical protein DH2020_014774 [Rehmannia glutinosa]|uniref:TOG domain-containing protein n=1 Tax=Rehmannia glutinosa TaxID=99300 RepID=A0ABR0WYB2_REHGL